MSDILNLPSPMPTARVSYGPERLQFGDLYLPKNRDAEVLILNIHGGFWRNRYDLSHAGHFCAALAEGGLPVWNVEYRRVGDEGGGWPGSFEDIRRAYRFAPQVAGKLGKKSKQVIVTGHSAGGHLALCLAAHEPSVRAVVSLAGVVDLQRARELRLSNDAATEFLGGKTEASDFAGADPMCLRVQGVEQWLIHGKRDETVPPEFSRSYWEKKKAGGEDVHLLEIEGADHMALVNPRSDTWLQVQPKISELASSCG